MMVVFVARPTRKERRPTCEYSGQAAFDTLRGANRRSPTRGPNRLSAPGRVRTANATAGLQGRHRSSPPRLLIMNFMRRHRLLVIAHMSGSIERAPEPMSKLFRLEKYLGGTRAACVLPTSQSPGTIQEFGENLLPPTAARSRIAIGESDRHGRWENPYPITLENASAMFEMEWSQPLITYQRHGGRTVKPRAAARLR